MAEVQGGDMRRLLDTLATQYGGSVEDLLAAARRGETPPPAAAPAPAAPAAEPWEQATTHPWTGPATRAGAAVHYDLGDGSVRCGSQAMPIVKVRDVQMVSCPQCRLLMSMPHISPCESEVSEWQAAATPPAPTVVEAPRRDRTWVPLVAGLGILGIVGIAAASFAFGGHGGSAAGNSAAAYTPPADTGTTGGSVAAPTAYSTPLPTEAPTPAPTAVPTPDPTAPAAQVQNVTVVDNQGQQQTQQQAQAQGGSTTAQTSITFLNHEQYGVDLFWVNSAGSETFYTSLAPGYSEPVRSCAVGMEWVIRWSPSNGAAGANAVIEQVTATAQPQTVVIGG